MTFKDSLHYNSAMSQTPLTAVRISFDPSTMNTAQKLDKLRKNMTVGAVNRWETAFLLLSVYRDGEWTHGLNGRPNRAAFIRYLKAAWGSDFDEAWVFTQMDAYNTFAKFGERAAKYINENAIGFSKLAIVAPWVSEDNVMTILDWCRVHPASVLRAMCRAKYDTKDVKTVDGKRPKAAPPHDEEGTTVRNFLASGANHFIDDMLFDPRHNAFEPSCIEAAFAMLYHEIRLAGVKEDVSFLNSTILLFAAQPKALQERVKAKWTMWVEMHEAHGGGSVGDWPLDGDLVQVTEPKPVPVKPMPAPGHASAAPTRRRSKAQLVNAVAA